MGVLDFVAGVGCLVVVLVGVCVWWFWRSCFVSVGDGVGVVCWCFDGVVLVGVWCEWVL